MLRLKDSIHFWKKNICLYADHATAMLATIQPRGSAAVQRAPALVQTLAAGPVVTAGTAEQILLWVCAFARSPPAVCVAILYSRGHIGQVADKRQITAEARLFLRGFLKYGQ